MFEVERNSPIETEILAEFFTRCGWRESGTSETLEWALAASEEWVSCRLDGELVGFGRSCRLDAMNRVVFDALVDPRFKDTGLRGEIVRLLVEGAGGLEVVSLFTEWHVGSFVSLPDQEVGEPGPGYFPAAPAGAYLGRRWTVPKGEE